MPRDVRWFAEKAATEARLPVWDSDPEGRGAAALSMKIRDNDPFFTVDVPVLRIRPCTQAELAAHTERWARSRICKLRRRLEADAKAGRRARGAIGSAAGQSAGPEPLPPWREVAAAWQRVHAIFDGLFLSDREEEQARIAFHRGGAHWQIFRVELGERKRDRAGLSRRA